MSQFLVIFLVILSSIILIESRMLDLPWSSGCKQLNSNCTSSTECCSGLCQNKKCVVQPCRRIHSSCNGTNLKCCDGLSCRSWDKKCCRSSGQQSLTPSECCFGFTTNTNGFQCCSQHAQPCQEDKDCCPGMGKCSKSGQWINICL